MKSQTSAVQQIKVFIDGEEVAELALLEDMGRVADFTFQTKKNIIYFKTITRTVVKGIAAHKAKEKLKKETKTKDNFVLRNIINLGVDAMVALEIRSADGAGFDLEENLSVPGFFVRKDYRLHFFRFPQHHRLHKSPHE